MIDTHITRRYATGILDVAPDAIILTDTTGCILLFNRCAAAIFGYHAEEVQGLPLDRLLPDRLVQHYQQHLKDAALRKEGYQAPGRCYEITGRRKDGSEFPIEATICAFSQDGRTGFITILRDISERQQAELALREQEQPYQAFVEHSPDMIMVSSYTGQILFINPGGARMLGVADPQQLLHRFVSDFFELNRLPTDELSPQGTPDGSALTLFEHQIHREDGHIRYLEMTALPIQYQGTPAVLSVGRDVTTRRQDREMLRKSEQRFQALFDQTFQHMALLHPDGIVIKINHAALVFAGLQPSDVVGRSLWEAPFWMDEEEAQRKIKAILTKASTGAFAFMHYEARVRGAGGRIATLDFSIKPLKDTTGHVILLLIEGRDVTGRKHAEDQLREREERYRAIVEQVTQGIFLIDIATMHVLEANPAFQHLLGYSAEEMKRLTIYDFVADRAFEEINFNIALALRHGWHFADDVQYRRKDQTLVNVEMSASLISYAETQALCVVVRDLTRPPGY